MEEGADFFGGEAEVVGAEFGELVTGAEAGEGERGFGAAGEDQMEVGRQVFQEVGHALMYFRGVEGVVVVEDEGEMWGVLR